MIGCCLRDTRKIKSHPRETGEEEAWKFERVIGIFDSNS
jgi:hypothetical protein